MSIKPVQNVVVGYVREDSRKSERAQRAAMAADAITKIYTDWSLLIRQRRRGAGDVIAVTDLYLIADTGRRTVKGGMRQSVIDRRAEARRAGATIFELSTGRTTATPDEADAMLSAALNTLAGTPARSTKTGRPPKTYSDHELTIMRLHWLALGKHRTNRAAVAAMAADGVKASVQKVTRLLGPSGRKPGTTGPKKPKPRRKRGVR